MSEEQELLARTAREFVTGRSSLKRIRRLRDAHDADGFSRELWREMAELGWLGIVIPEEHGGAGLGYMDLMVVLEELGRGPHARADALDRPARRRRRCSSAAARRRSASTCRRSPPASGSSRSPTRSRGAATTRDHVETRAAKSGSGFVLRGEKIAGARRPRRRLADRLGADRRARRATPAASRCSCVRRRHAGRDDRAAARASTAGTPRSCGSTTCGSSADAVLGDVDRRRRAARARRSTAPPIALCAEMLGGMTAALRDDARVPEDAGAVRRPDRHLPGAQAPRRARCTSRSSSRARR